ncbi:lysine 6-monooxygenase [Pullulanibacillus camelliae]|uniref:L-lysine N6-monooxygenase MbtG n=1 Tax=Pullulanibacillus camelliae TaxID=1707096 RepID=A0A8J2VKV1_9BACL|nr:lysine N(6)-hydroxylase/L-ornithine N(5)-oxygenase family protein [Pullulanibacillus camelliae]GGE30155.1 lysine 6-monooxygenase [Pullulanibacillus camelliae]
MGSQYYNANDNVIYDLIGIGIGPFNLGLAALLTKAPEVNSLFFEQHERFDWHPGMLIEGTTLQVPFLADLVSMADVTSPYSFLNYLQSHQRLYSFYFLENFHIPRQEYNHYCQWVAGQLPHCHFGAKVTGITKINGGFEVKVMHYATQSEKTYIAKHIVVGTGTIPFVPPALREHLGKRVFHSADYLLKKKTTLRAKSITVIGSGQSAAEIFYNLLEQQNNYDYALTWLTRSRGFFPMEYSKLGLEHFSPDYIDYFQQLSQQKRDEIFPKQDLLYKGISVNTIAAIYDLLYTRSIGGVIPAVTLQAMIEIERLIANDGKWELQGRQWQQNKPFKHSTEVVILGTGYHPAIPDCLEGLKALIDWDEQGRYKVDAHYRLQLTTPASHHVYIQNGEWHTHGIGAPDLGLGAHRNAMIINDLTERELYPVHKKNVFQTFGVTNMVSKRSEAYVGER